MPTYAEALAYLDSFINYEKVPGIGYGARRYDLNSFARFLAALGNPHYLHDCLHVAGTKGKGSTSALAAAGLTGLGLKVGLYTSPHLVTIRERISVGGRLVREEEFARIITELQPVAARLGRTEKTFRTFFELVTAAGMLHFQASGCGQVVYETGMGGRLDATNVVPAGVAGITAISIDHTQALGATLAAIATEKAGIIKPGQMVISAAQEPDAAAVLRETSRRRRATLLEVGTDIDFVIRRHDINGLMCDVRYLDETPLRLAIPLAGRHQAENCAVAYGMVRAYCQRAGLSVDRGAVADAMATVRWPGRLQTVSRDGPTLILDGAHNPAAGRALAAALTELFPNRRLIGVIGCSADKDYPGVLANLLPVLDGAVFTRFSSPRAAAPEKLAALAPPTMDARLADNAATALATADEMAGDGGIVIATGSLFLVGDLLAVHSA